MLDKAVQTSGAELEAGIKQKILTSQPAGRTYRRSPITRAATSRNLPAGLRRTKNKNRVIVGSNFHRASRRGQPPAVDTAGLINSIRARKTGPLKTTVSAGKHYGEILDDPNKLNRPFFRSTVKEYLPKFKENILEVIKSGG